jgi:hypothetical protein
MKNYFASLLLLGSLTASGQSAAVIPNDLTASAQASSPEQKPATVVLLAKPGEEPAPAGKLFSEGTKALNIGLGFGLNYGYYGNPNAVPALVIIYDQGVKDGIGPGTISVGGILGYKRFTYKYPPYYNNGNKKYKASWTNVVVGARGAYHLPLDVDKLDTYAGLMLGVRIQSWDDNWYEDNGYPEPDYSSAYLTSGIFIGARYMFTDKIGAFAEVGYDISILKLGVSINL